MAGRLMSDWTPAERPLAARTKPTPSLSSRRRHAGERTKKYDRYYSGNVAQVARHYGKSKHSSVISRYQSVRPMLEQ